MNVTTFLAQKLVNSVLVLLALSVLVFSILQLISGAGRGRHGRECQ